MSPAAARSYSARPATTRIAAPRQAVGALPLPDRAGRRGSTLRSGPPVVATPGTSEGTDRAGRASFVFLVLVVLSLGLVSLLVVNTALARNSFNLSELQRTHVELGERSQALQEDLARASSPAALARSAKELGMVPAGSLAYLRLADGTISGRASIARGAAVPLTPEQKAESEAAAAKKKAKAAAKAKADRLAAIARAEAEAAARAAEQARIKAAAKAKALKAKQAAQDKAASQGRGETLLAPPQPQHAPSEGLTR